MRQGKRPFVPMNNSVYADRKRVPPGCNVQQVQNNGVGPADWQGRIQVQSWAQSSETYRQGVINAQLHGTALPNPPGKQENCQRNVVRPRKPAPNPVDETNCSMSTSFSSDVVRCTKPPTSIQPFNLSFEYRSKKPDVSEDSFKFIPREMPNFSDPFKPVLNGGAKTKPIDFCFYTEARADKREIFEERVRMNEKARQAELDYKRAQEAEREQEEIRRIRKQAEFKAKPIMSGFSVNARQNGCVGVNQSALWNIRSGVRK